jgi:hypothetical protein
MERVMGELIVEALLESVAVRVMEWVPAGRAFVTRGVPVPIIPEMLDLQTRDAPERGPSSGSVAVP